MGHESNKWPWVRIQRAIAYIETEIKGVHKMKVCGSVRRGLEMVGDIDFVVAPKKGKEEELRTSIKRFADKVLADGKRTIRILGKTGIQADFMIVAPIYFESAVLHSTGSKIFNIRCRKKAKSLGLKLNEYGLWEGTKRIATTEKTILTKLGKEKYLRPERR